MSTGKWWEGEVRRRTASYVLSQNPCKVCGTHERYKNGNCVACLLAREKAKQSDPEFAESKRKRENDRYHHDIESSQERVRDTYARNRETIRNSVRTKYATNEEYRSSVLLASKEYRQNNLEWCQERDRAYQSKNKHKRRVIHHLWVERQGDEYREKQNEYLREHYEANKDYYHLKKKKRDVLIKQASVPWRDTSAITRIKKKAKEMTKKTGVQYSVDHIVPIVGCNENQEHVVCGLHWEGNLQVTPLVDNLKKGKRHRKQ